ncbi:hypothetical protein D1007_12302 [Hordeum vulgare]|nr:hypothetical protein D1007_12302 [Hordeum vulgare]
MEVMEARERLPKETKGKTKKENQAWDEAQSAFNKEEVEEVDFLQPYLHLLSPSLIELLSVPVRHLAVSKFNSNYKAEPKFHKWFLSPALDQLEELNFGSGHQHLLPPFDLCLTPTLHRAMFVECFSPKINDMHVLHLPKLKHLELIAVSISKDDLEPLLRNCTSLEYLRLQVMFGFSGLHIAMMNLHMIYVHGWCHNTMSVGVFHDMVIENAPFLERLFVLEKEGPARIRVIDSTKLTVLGYLCVEFSKIVIVRSVPVKVQ